jgi:hypothetical protein
MILRNAEQRRAGLRAAAAVSKQKDEIQKLSP